MAAGDIVSHFIVDKRQFEGGLAVVKKDLASVRKEIAMIAPAAAAGNKEAFTSLVSLVGVEEHLADVARRTAETEAQARRLVVGQVKEQIVQEQRLEQVIQRRAIVFGQRAQVGGRLGAMGAMGGGLGTGLAYGLSDAVTAAQFGGGRAAALSISNNLPQIGQGLANVGAAAAKAGGPLGKIGGLLLKWAGPTGLILSVAVPLAAAFVPALLETESAAEKAEKSLKNLDSRLEKIRKEQKDKSTLETLTNRNTESERDAQSKTLEEQRSKVAELRKEYEALQQSLIELTQSSARRDDIDPFLFGTGDREQLEDIRRQIAENEKRLRETQKELQNQERSLSEGEATRRRVTGEGREFIGQRSTVAQDQEYRLRLVREQSERERTERLEAQRLRNLDEESMQRSILAGFGARRDQLLRQREGLSQSRRSFNLPELATRGNSVDKIIEMAQAKKEAVAESQRKMQLEKLEKQIELLNRLIESVRGIQTLKPARVG